MAMNKKEKEQLTDLKKQLFLARALRVTDKVEPDVPIPSGEDWNKLSTGFMHAGGQSTWPRIEPACSSSVYHSVGRNDKTTSQNGKRLFSTKLLAMRALRNEIEQDCMRRLANIDTMIAVEMGTETKEQ